jgi:outer membrane murein-binding lipoprotein Lpp
MTNRLMLVAAATAACAGLAGCATLTPEYDARFGKAVQVSTAGQVYDAQATARHAKDDAATMDGRAARAAYNRYVLSFIRPQPAPNVFTIGVMGSTNGNPSSGGQ